MKPGQAEGSEYRVGTNDQLSLRVSVATLARVVFMHPDDGRTMLALERTATLLGAGGVEEVIVKAIPFGGSVQINDPDRLRQRVGPFHFDSRRSRAEMDFRILINPQNWARFKRFCLSQFEEPTGILETTPERELKEEFMDAVGLPLGSSDFEMDGIGFFVQDQPLATQNVRAPGLPTTRIYYLSEVRITAARVKDALLRTSRSVSDAQLQAMAWRDARCGGRGRANAVLVLPLEQVARAHRAVAGTNTEQRLRVEGHRLDDNVWVLFQDASPTS